MLNRAAFLPTTGDPYVILHCLKFFEDVWQDEVDKLYIAICTTVNRSTIFNLINILKQNSKVCILYVDHGISHGDGIDLILSQSTEENIMLLEDDAIIHKKGIVDHYFKKIESGEYDLIGSERSCCTSNIIELAKNRWNLDFSGAGDRGPGYWPCFLWIKRKYMKATDRIFSNYSFKVGEKLFDTVLTEEAVGDTFMWASLQLREMGLKILNIPQFHCHPVDFKRTVTPWGALCPGAAYMHMGSLSGGIKNVLLDENNIPLADLDNSQAPKAQLHPPSSLGEKLELERRVAWWRESYRIINLPEDRFTRGYKHGLQNVIIKWNLSETRLDKWTEVYKEITNVKHN